MERRTRGRLPTKRGRRTGTQVSAEEQHRDGHLSSHDRRRQSRRRVLTMNVRFADCRYLPPKIQFAYAMDFRGIDGLR